MNSIMKCLTAVLTIVSATATVQASTLKSDLLLYVPKSIVRGMASKFNGNFQYAAGNVTVPGEFPVNLDNLVVTFDYQMQSLNPNSSSFDAGFGISNAKATMDALHIDAFSDQVINGQPVRIHIKLDCQNIVVTANAGFNTAATGHIANGPLTVVMDDMNWATGSQFWNFSAGACQGASVADATNYLQNQINQMWSSPSDLKNMIMGELNNRVTQWVAQRSTWSQNFPGINTMLFARASEFIDTATSWVFRMGGEFTTVKDCPSFVAIGSLPPMSPTNSPSNIEIDLPTAISSVISQCASEMGIFNRADNTKNIPAFAQLMGSDVAKQSVWPDLMRYPATAQFMFYTITNGTTSLSPATVANPATNSLYFNLATTVVSTMRYIRNSVEEAYMTFASPLRGGIQIIAKGAAYNKPSTFSLQWSSDPQIKLNYRFDVSKNVVTDTKVDTTTLEGQLVPVIKSQTFSYNMDPLPITDAVQLGVSGLNRGSDSLQLIFSLYQK